MTREEKVHSIADELVKLLNQPEVEMVEVPDEQHTVLLRGRVNLLVVAEWILARMG